MPVVLRFTPRKLKNSIVSHPNLVRLPSIRHLA